jgi:hypothetical protein
MNTARELKQLLSETRIEMKRKSVKENPKAALAADLDGEELRLNLRVIRLTEELKQARLREKTGEADAKD